MKAIIIMNPFIFESSAYLSNTMDLATQAREEWVLFLCNLRQLSPKMAEDLLWTSKGVNSGPECL